MRKRRQTQYSDLPNFCATNHIKKTLDKNLRDCGSASTSHFVSTRVTLLTLSPTPWQKLEFYNLDISFLVACLLSKRLLSTFSSSVEESWQPPVSKVPNSHDILSKITNCLRTSSLQAQGGRQPQQQKLPGMSNTSLILHGLAIVGVCLLQYVYCCFIISR